jgi:cytochrome c oxidase assembly factor CtaG
MVGSVAALVVVLLAVPVQAHVGGGDSVFAGWHWRWDVGIVLIVFGVVYFRGWLRLRRGGEARLSEAVSYVLALAAIAGALLSPLDDLASYLLIAHMAQHELLMMIAPPLILLANPVPALFWGLNRRSRLQAGYFLSRDSAIRRVRDFVGSMPVAWCLYVGNLWAWHYPALYQAALQNTRIHDLEHILFFLTALVFWWPIMRPISRPAPIQDGLRILYIFLAATQDAVLSGLIALSNRILYPHYETALRLWDLTPREDQVGGGIVMFAVGSTTYLVAALVLVNLLLGGGRNKRSMKRASSEGAENVVGSV